MKKQKDNDDNDDDMVKWIGMCYSKNERTRKFPLESKVTRSTMVITWFGLS